MRRPNPLRIIVHISAWLPLAWLVFDYFSGNLSVNPIQAIEQRSGKIALVFLTASLACTPLNTLLGFRQAIAVRRPLGLYSFLYVVMHFLTLIGLDYQFNLTWLWLDMANKRYVLFGLAAGIILFSLAVTSYHYWQKRLKKNWKRLHRLVYLAGVLVGVHYFLAKKGAALTLQGDIWQPLLFALLLSFLLLVRIPPIKEALIRLRKRRTPSPKSKTSSQKSLAG